MNNGNSAVSSEIKAVARLQESAEGLPSSFSNNIQLSAEVNPKLVRRVEKVKSLGAGSLSIPANKVFLLCSYSLNTSHQATDTGTSASIIGTVGGESVSIASLRFVAAEVSNQALAVSFVRPIPVTSSLSLSATDIAATSAIIHGYFEDA